MLLPLGEYVIGAAIIGGLVGLLLPAVEEARQVRGEHSLLPQVLAWINDHSGIFLWAMPPGCALTALVCFWGLRLLAPAWLWPHIPW